MENREKWFIDRIGKRVFRNKSFCNCDGCISIYENGLVIHDKIHAERIYCMEETFNYMGYFLMYFDSKEEAEEFERAMPKQ